jgi:chloramphenicol-sensitive protein RarD
MSGKVPGALRWLVPADALVSPELILSHRVLWSVALLVGMISVMGLWGSVVRAVRSGRTMRMLLLSTLMVSTNWFLFTWCNTHGRILQTSLGYFLNPILSALLGMVFLGERLRRLQWAAVAVASVGVLSLAVGFGQVPSLALLVALTFGFYGLIRKVAPVDALAGLFVETTLLLPVALGYIWYASHAGLSGGNPSGHLLVYLALGCGMLTTIPLLCFAKAAKLLPLSTLGFLQYTGPTCQFLCATVVFHEPFTATHAVAFALIWTAVGMFITDALRQPGRSGVRQVAVEEPA